MIVDKKIRLDRFLSENLNISRSQIAQLIAKNAVQINGKIALKAGVALKINDEIQIKNLRESIKERESLVPKSNLFIERIYEDDDILVLNKPPFLATHGAPSLKEESLVDWLKAHKIECSNISGESRMGIIHRLDKQTSGAIVVAKNNTAHSLLSAQLADKSMGRIYLAIIDLPLREDLEIECYLGRNPNNRLKMSKIALKDSRVDSRNLGANRGDLTKDSRRIYSVDSHSDSRLDSPKIPRGVRYSKSRFIKLLTSKDSTKELICAQLFTGRTHQIRAHLESINRHIIGDELYGYKSAKNAEKYRVMLHSYLLYLTHPKDCGSNDLRDSHKDSRIDSHKKDSQDSAQSHSKNAKMLFLANLFDDMNHFLEKYFDMEKVDEILRNLPNRFSF